MNVTVNSVKISLIYLDEALYEDRLLKTFDDDILSFLIKLVKADRKIKNEEVDFINKELNLHLSKKSVESLVKTTKLDDLNGEYCPKVVKKLLVKIYDDENLTQKVADTIESISTLFKTIGLNFLSCDEDTNPKEVKLYSKYTTSLSNIARNTVNDLNNYILPGDPRHHSYVEEKESVEEEVQDLDSLLEELNSLIGLSEVKEEINTVINLIKIRKLREERGFTNMPMSFHMVFTGNPGTGKTTVARLLSKIYKEIGILSSGHLVETDRSGLVAGYIGQTSIKAKEVCESAHGGILFIDEAYSLTHNRGESDYGFEAVDTILKDMEDNRNDLIVIVAGYPKPMESFIKSNPGLKSRFSKFIEFKDYSKEELLEIFLSITNKNNYLVSEKAEEKIKLIIEEMIENDNMDDFGNARGIRNMFEKAVSKQATRISTIKDIDDDTLITITDEDIE